MAPQQSLPVIAEFAGGANEAIKRLPGDPKFGTQRSATFVSGWPILDALLETEAGLEIIRHHIDGGGVTDLVFALCHMLGFAFVPRIPDLDGRCLYGFEPARQYGGLENVMGERIDADLIRTHWDDMLRLATSIRTRTVSASLMLKRLSSTPAAKRARRGFAPDGAHRMNPVRARLDHRQEPAPDDHSGAEQG